MQYNIGVTLGVAICSSHLLMYNREYYRIALRRRVNLHKRLAAQNAVGTYAPPYGPSQIRPPPSKKRAFQFAKGKTTPMFV